MIQLNFNHTLKNLWSPLGLYTEIHMSISVNLNVKQGLVDPMKLFLIGASHAKDIP
jgi:hypothetical protein